MTEAFNWNVRKSFIPIFYWYQITLISVYAGANWEQTYRPSDNKWTDWEKSYWRESFNNTAARKKAEKDRRQLSEDKWGVPMLRISKISHLSVWWSFDGPHISHAWNNIGCELPCDLPVCTVIPWWMCSLGNHPCLVSCFLLSTSIGSSFTDYVFTVTMSCSIPKKAFCRSSRRKLTSVEQVNGECITFQHRNLTYSWGGELSLQ